MCEGWTNSYWKHQVLMLYPLRENSENLMGRGVACNPPPLYVRGLISLIIHFVINYWIIYWLNFHFYICKCVCNVVLCVMQGFQLLKFINLWNNDRRTSVADCRGPNFEQVILVPHLAPKSAQICAAIWVRSVREFILKSSSPDIFKVDLQYTT